MISSGFIDKKAASSQIDRYTIIREYTQLLFLRCFYEVHHKVKFYFKGGTAIRFLFNSFRFSADLDFTCVGSANEIAGSIENLLPGLEAESGFTILVKDEKMFKETGFSCRLVLQPAGIIRRPMGIRLDFSFREKPLEPEVSPIAVYDYPVSPLPLVMHLSKNEILAEKARALITRKTPRDLFDLWFLLKQGSEPDWNLIAEKMKVYPGEPYNRNILRQKIERFKTNDLRRDLNRFLPASYRDVYPKLLKEVLELL